MRPFYAYLKHSQRDDNWRWIMAFASREVADEWWRTISTLPSPYLSHVQRFSPHFYTYNPDGINIPDKFFEWPGARPFLNKMFFTLLKDRGGRHLSVVPPVELTDHISGKWYFIRSRDEPSKYWYLNTDDQCLVCEDKSCNSIHVSTAFRTKFSIRVRNLAGQHVPDNGDFVMIGADQISIAASDDHGLNFNDRNMLKAAKGYESLSSVILFGDLKDRFVTRGTKVETKTAGMLTREYVARVEKGQGEAWELVD